MPVSYSRCNTSVENGFFFFLMAYSGLFLMFLTWNVIVTMGCNTPALGWRVKKNHFSCYLNVSGWNTLLDSCFIARVLTIFSFIQPWKPNESNDLGVHFSGCLSFLPSFLWAFIFPAVFYTPFVFSLLFPPSSVVPTFNSLHPPSFASVPLPLCSVFHGAPHGILNTITVHSWMERKGPWGSLGTGNGQKGWTEEGTANP